MSVGLHNIHSSAQERVSNRLPLHVLVVLLKKIWPFRCGCGARSASVDYRTQPIVARKAVMSLTEQIYQAALTQLRAEQAVLKRAA